MTRYGYTLMTEQSGPRELVRYAAGAEKAGFDFEVMSDHYFPWLDEQGHAGYAWSMLGAVSQVTERVELMTYVTCPILRYHPAVVAQKAATIGILSDNRFTLGLGAGENLNEHVVGEGWPPVNMRHEMLEEATIIIKALLEGGYVNFTGDHYRVDSAKLWDLPEERVEIGVAVSGKQSIETFAPLADHLVAVEPEEGLVQQWDTAHDGESRKIGQLPVCWDTDRAIRVRRCDPVRAARGRRRVDPVRPRPRRDRGGGARVRAGRLHRRRARADRRRAAGGVPPGRRGRAPPRAAGLSRLADPVGRSGRVRSRARSS
jgi:G6PDH family F420-dependent oxidoreductase